MWRLKFVYKQNYFTKVIILCIFALVLCILSDVLDYKFVIMPESNITDYHTDILTVNSIFCGFALTNLGILLSISDDQLIKKLEGTDILQKRNIVIGHSIIFGSISIFISMFWVLKINFKFIENFIAKRIIGLLQEFFFYIEIISLLISILYFIVSIKKMIELLALLHVPKKRYSEKQVDNMKKKIFK